MQPSVPIAMLLTKDVAYEWHDGVALAAQLVAQVRADIPHAEERIPDLRGVTLEGTGALALSAHPEHSMPAMPGAAQLLQQLLSGKEQPTPLRLFAMQAATAEPPMSLALFAEELEKWERPNRLAKLGALYQRAFEQIGPAALTDEAKLREARAQEAMRGPVNSGGAAAPAAAAKTPAGQNAQAVTVTAVIIGVVMLAAAGGTWFVFNGKRPAPQPAAVATASETAPIDSSSTTTAGSSGSSPAARRAARPQASAAPPSAVVASAEAELARGRELFARQDYAAAAAAFDRVLQILAREPGPQLEELRQVARSMADVSRAAIAEQVEAATREYRVGDEGVIDPVALGFLPPKPDPATPAERLQVLEVRINASGTVDSAKFVMNRPSFRNSWWISAAKAWRFSPATRNGQPVRFVMRIVMDDSAGR